MFSLSSRHTDRPRWARRIVLLLLLLAIPFLLASPKPMTASMVADSENGTKVLILNYHKIDDTFIALAVRPEDFDAQMKYLSEHGYHTITPAELYDSLAGNAELPENPVLITFDDGYEDNYTISRRRSLSSRASSASIRTTSPGIRRARWTRTTFPSSRTPSTTNP